MSQIAATQGKRIVILGGGISGLSFLHYLRVFASAIKKDHLLNKVVLVEKEDYLGGFIKSKLYQDGVVHELGPRFIRCQGVKAQCTMALVEHLQLDKEAVILSAKNSKKRQIYTKDGQIGYLPDSIWSLFKKLPGTDATLAKAVFRDMFKAKRMDLSPYRNQDPPMYDFVKHRAGEEITEALLDPIIRGLAAGDCRKLSSKAMIGDLIEKEQHYGSVLKSIGKPPIKKVAHDDLYTQDVLSSKFIARARQEKIVSYTLTNGLASLPERLANSLMNNNPGDKVNIYNQTKAVEIEFENDWKNPCSVIVQNPEGDKVKIDADHIVSAIPSVNLGEVLKISDQSKRRSIWDEIVNIPHNPIGTVVVEYSDPQLATRKNLQATGIITHSKSDSKALSISYDNMLFRDKDPSVFKVNVNIGGEWYDEIFGKTCVDSAKLEDIALAEIRRLSKIIDEPKRVTSFLWETGIPQYRPGHKDMIGETRFNIKRLGLPVTLIGQSYDGYSLNDVIFSSRMAAYDFVNNTLCDIHSR